MAESLELPQLFVEGDSDLHTIIHLLARHDLMLDRDLGPVQVKKAQNDRGVLDVIRTAVRASTNRAVGFVIDANGSVAARWQSVCDRLKGTDLDLPPTPPPKGYVGESNQLRNRVGVWIMPDNVTDSGRLEHLVRTLVPENDMLFPHAQAATAEAAKLEKRFAQQDGVKAELHCWLAWQKEPGMPFGMALKARIFRHDSDVALRYLLWFKMLFQV